MNLFHISMAMTIVGTIGYHVCNKSVPSAVHPAASLVATYAVALVLSAGLLLADAGSATFVEQARRVSWASYVLGVAVTAIELGFVLAYRAGWVLSSAQLSSTVGGSLLLVPIGLLVFHERLSLSNFAGIVISLVGIFLMARR